MLTSQETSRNRLRSNSMIAGVGVDLVDVARFEAHLAETPRLIERLFTETERTAKLESLAGKFAAKEALIKALGGSDGVHWHDVEISKRDGGQPFFETSGSTKKMIAEAGISKLHLSISHDAGMAIAMVVAEA